MTTNYAQTLEVATRTDGTTFVRSTDDVPDWLYDAIMSAHDGESPDDWRWATCRDILAMIDDGETDTSVIADTLTDIYTHDVLTWYADRLDRIAYADEYAESFDPDGVVSSLRGGQFLAIEQMATILCDAIAENQEVEGANDGE
jgi:hypothetical protein